VSDKQSTGKRNTWRRLMFLALGILGVIAPPQHRASAETGTRAQHVSPSPHRIAGDAADVLVRIVGGQACSGTPIAGTRYVVTAAHCVLGPDGKPGPRTVVRADAKFDAVAILVDTAYATHPSVRLDAAVLVLDRPLPGPSARLGTALPTHGTLSLTGYQPLDSDGTLLRGTNPHNRPLPKNAAGPVIEIQSAPAGCVVAITEFRISRDHVIVPCGLIPGASGGGLYANAPEGITLVGIVSTVSSDLTVNGVVPLASLHELLAHTDAYSHDVSHIDAGSGNLVQRS